MYGRKPIKISHRRQRHTGFKQDILAIRFIFRKVKDHFLSHSYKTPVIQYTVDVSIIQGIGGNI